MRSIFLFLFVLLPFFSAAQHQDKVDFVFGNGLISPQPKEKAIRGIIAYSFNVLNDVDSVFLDAKNMEFSSVTLNYQKVAIQ